ncbi:hypothetical protein G9A89_023138 [Geosiphon pyriformis]|nr:hypothetical protein G9A89_023138 [Geosiphon pyriformis]
MDENLEKFAGMIAVCISGALSNVIAMGMIVLILLQKQQKNLTVSRLVMNMLFSDWLQSFGFILSLRWISDGELTSGTYCVFQGVLINIGDIASGCWATAICLHTYMGIVHSYKPSLFLKVAIAIIWPFSVLISVIGFMLRDPGTPFYDSAGGSWCWISPKYSAYRIGFHYGIILLLAIIMIVLYGAMCIILFKHYETVKSIETKRLLSRTARRLIFYPLAYLIVIFPLGLRNAIYGITRHLVSVRPTSLTVQDRNGKEECAKRPPTVSPSIPNLVDLESNSKDEITYLQ